MTIQEKTKVFIDESVNILTGAEADEALLKRNDRGYFTDGKGVAKVSRDRWVSAQTAERAHWMGRGGLRASSDRNEEHWRNFDYYSSIAGRTFERAIEVGCGPFTNMRFISTICKIKQLDLLDPLMNDYTTHPFCRFKGGELILDDPQESKVRKLSEKVLGRLSPQAFLTAKKWLHRSIPVNECFALGAEDLPAHSYDLIVMINVIEHCLDVEAIFERVLKAAAPNAIFVFHDKLYRSKEVQETLEYLFDAAHPLRVDGQLVESFLLKNFETLLWNRKSLEKIYANGDKTEKNLLYYVGRLKSE